MTEPLVSDEDAFESYWQTDVPKVTSMTAEAITVGRRLALAVASLKESVEINPRKCHGIPVLKGTRFKVAQVLAQFAAGDSLDELVNDLDLDRATIVGFLRGLSIALDRPRFDEDNTTGA